MLSIYEMSKRYIAAALVGAITVIAGAIGVAEVVDPVMMEKIEGAATGVAGFVFYSVTILAKTWFQKRALEKGQVLQERVESQQTAIEHASGERPGTL